MNEYKAIYIDLEKDNLISLQELAQILSVSINELRDICREKNVGKITADGNIFIDNNIIDFFDGDLYMLKIYVEHKNIEDEVLEYIKAHDKTTVIKIANDTNLGREVVQRILVVLTWKYPELWEMSIGKTDFLFYGSEKYVDSGS